MLKVSVLSIVCCLLIGSAFSASIDCNIDECRKPMKIYEELGCKPIYGSKSCCPKRYECPDDLKVVKDDSKCTFKGEQYKIGDLLPRSLTNESKCLEACICSRYEDEPAQFVCTSSDCGISSLKVPGCVNIYGDLNECCSTSIVCDDEEKEKLATCWDANTKYHEGEKFRSKSNPCYECLCHKDYDNTTIIEKNSHCQKLNCEIELKYKSFIQRGCLPIFENDKCCPVDWKCFDSVKKGKKIVKRSSDDDSSDESSEDDYYEKLFDNETEESEETTTELSKKESVPPLEVPRLVPPLETKTTPMTSEESATKLIEETTLSSNAEERTTISEDESIDSTAVSALPTESTSEEITESSSVTATESSTAAETVDSTTISAIESSTAEKSESILAEATESLLATATESSTDEKLESVTTESTTQAIEPNPEESSKSTLVTTETSTKLVSDSTSIKTTEPIVEEATESYSVTETTKSSSEKTAASIDSTTALTDKSQGDESSENNSTEEKDDSKSKEFDKSDEDNLSSESTKTEAITTEATVSKDQNLSPPVPTVIDNLLTTLKDLQNYALKLVQAPATKTSEEAPPASFVNFTLSRSLPIVKTEELNEENQKPQPENDESVYEKKIRKRSVDAKSFYLKHSVKEKGCKVGAQFYKVGDEIKTDDKCLDCICQYSPIGHCTRNEKCFS